MFTTNAVKHGLVFKFHNRSNIRNLNEDRWLLSTFSSSLDDIQFDQTSNIQLWYILYSSLSIFWKPYAMINYSDKNRLISEMTS